MESFFSTVKSELADQGRDVAVLTSPLRLLRRPHFETKPHMDSILHGSPTRRQIASSAEHACLTRRLPEGRMD